MANKSIMYKKVWQTLEKHGFHPSPVIIELKSDIDIEDVVLKILDVELGQMVSCTQELRKEVIKLQIKLAKRRD